MITSAQIISHLSTGLGIGYTVRDAKPREEDIPALTELTLVTVGYGPIRGNATKEAAALDIYNLQGEDLTQSIYITIACPVANFDTAFKAVYKQLAGWNPITSENSHTSFTFIAGEPIAQASSVFWFISEWKIGFPTSTLL